MTWIGWMSLGVIILVVIVVFCWEFFDLPGGYDDRIGK